MMTGEDAGFSESPKVFFFVICVVHACMFKGKDGRIVDERVMITVC